MTRKAPPTTDLLVPKNWPMATLAAIWIFSTMIGKSILIRKSRKGFRYSSRGTSSFCTLQMSMTIHCWSLFTRNQLGRHRTLCRCMLAVWLWTRQHGGKIYQRRLRRPNHSRQESWQRAIGSKESTRPEKLSVKISCQFMLKRKCTIGLW